MKKPKKFLTPLSQQALRIQRDLLRIRLRRAIGKSAVEECVAFASSKKNFFIK
jgi:hypothetical protein